MLVDAAGEKAHVTQYTDGVYYCVDIPRALAYAIIVGTMEPVVDEVVNGPCPWHLTAQGFCDCLDPDPNHPVSGGEEEP